MARHSDKNRHLGSYDLQGRTVEVVDGLGRVDLDNLVEEYEEAGAQSIWWGTLYARARKLANMAKFRTEVLWGQIAKEARAAAEARAVRITDEGVKEAVRTDPRYQQAMQEYFDAEEKADALESAKFTSARKHDQLSGLVNMVSEELRARNPRPPAPGRRPM